MYKEGLLSGLIKNANKDFPFHNIQHLNSLQLFLLIDHIQSTLIAVTNKIIEEHF